ncbi:MAG TPA: hypothetical protein DDZ78_13350 [Porphyromonadaceae bacterium]|nr:hypothetical protein [Porphyromonadaceae bacterium]
MSLDVDVMKEISINKGFLNSIIIYNFIVLIMKINLIKIFSIAFLFSLLFACENNLEMTLPQGPQGEKGDKGDPGLSAFDLWKEVYGKDPNTPIDEFFNSLKGKDGADGLTPYIKNDNWWIGDKDTGVPARGQDGKTPTVEIGPGPDYFWIIDGTATTVSAKGIDGKDGKDGKDGFTPVLGDNGNWFIDGKDTDKPWKVIPEIGTDGNWWIDGLNTEKPARGPKGEDGLSAYELWKDAVDKGEMTNKDGSDYTGGNTWEEFLKWLQGGDVSVLHQYWTTLPGNEGKTIEQFIEELFDCHCDGITVGLQFEDKCIELNPDGTLKGTYSATLRIGGKAGTSVKVTGKGVDLSGNITNDQTPITFTIQRGDENIPLAIECTEGGNVVNKTATIPALKYIKLGSATTVTQVQGEQKDVVVITFAAAPVEVFVGGTLISSANGIVEGSGWAVSNEGKTFTKTYDRAATEQKPTVQAKGADPICSTIANAFTIPTLTPVEVTGNPVLAVIPGNNCNLQLTLQGTPGMTVTATYPGLATPIKLTESPAGTYTTTGIPRKFTAYDVTVEAKMDGRGTVKKSVRVEGAFLFTNTLQVTNNNGTSATWSNAIVANEFKNTGTEPIIVTFTGRTGNAGAQNIKRNSPSHGAYPFILNLQPGQTETVQFYRDYTITFANGNYSVNYTVSNDCGESAASASFAINNQQNYKAKFTKPAGWGGPGQPGGPGWDPKDPNAANPDITFNVEVTNAIPNSFVEFQLYNGTGYSAKFRGQVDANGKLTQSVTMPAKDLAVALDDGFAIFRFFKTQAGNQLLDPYNIGAEKETVKFAFE